MTTVPRDLEAILSDLRAAVTADAAQASAGNRRRWLLLAAAALAAVVLTAVALAATTGLFDRDVTRADIDARPTVTRTIRECRAPGECGPPSVVRETYTTPADGITFVDPEGRLIFFMPAGGFFTYMGPMSSYAHEFSRSVREEAAEVRLPDGGTRTLTWTSGRGLVTVTDNLADGTTSRTTLHSGDIVPLVPGTLDDRPLTPDKAVVVDLDRGNYPVYIYPQLNRAYVAGIPWEARRRAQVPDATARRYALLPAGDGDWTLPIDRSGGTWSFPVAGDRVRTIEWKAGERSVVVVDRDRAGNELGRELVRIGRHVPAE